LPKQQRLWHIDADQVVEESISSLKLTAHGRGTFGCGAPQLNPVFSGPITILAGREMKIARSRTKSGLRNMATRPGRGYAAATGCCSWTAQ
jgi:hypothetical protein